MTCGRHVIVPVSPVGLEDWDSAARLQLPKQPTGPVGRLSQIRKRHPEVASGRRRRSHRSSPSLLGALRVVLLSRG